LPLLPAAVSSYGVIGTEANTLNDISESNVLATLRRQMTISVARQVASAGNLANVDTPGYKAKEVTFADALKGKLAQPANSTFKGKTAPGLDAAVTVKEADLPARRDGNTVQLDQELLTMSRSANDFASAQTALAAKFRLVRYAINEGK
jgi:flagellar basal-body rod protein FlgB